MIRKIILITTLLSFIYSWSNAQEVRIDSLATRLDVLAANGVLLNQPITINYDGQLKDFVSFLAESTKLNMTVMPGVDAKSTSVSFSNAPVRDVILYLCRAHQLDLRFTGTIISFVQYSPPLPPAIAPRDLDISYRTDSSLLTLDLREDTLDVVVRKIAALTAQNIVLEPGIRFVKVNGYIAGVGLESALKQLAANNHLTLRKEADYFKLESKFPLPNTDPNAQPYNPNRGAVLQIDRASPDLINIQAFNADVLDIVREAAAQLNINYYLLPEGGSDFNQQSGNRGGQGNNNGQGGTSTLTIQAQQISFRDLLQQVFKNTGFDFVEQSGLYIIGRRTAETLRDYKIYQFQNRSIRGVAQLIPQDLIYDVAIDTMAELNSFILSGSKKSVQNIQRFFDEIDKLIPVILIEIVLIDVQTNKLSDFGIEAGTTPGGIKPGGAIVSSTTDKGGFNFSFSPNAINNLLKLLAGRDIINLGKVSPDFYLTLQAVQEDGIIEIKSTPKLSTLNSHRATLSIGQSRYYQEQQVVYPGADRPIPIQSNVFREVEANLDIDITPMLSGDEQVTLNINFEQTEFLGESSLNTPPPRVSRKFESMIRVKNGEMVVLGGLEYQAKTKTRRGFPFLSKIPLIGWLFGRHKQTKQKNKLLIFVKPTIVN